MKLTAKILLPFVILTLFLGLIKTPPISAAGASFYLSPAYGTKLVGDRFNVFVYASASQDVNTFDVYLSTSNMTVLGINSSGSICLLFPEQPSYTPSSARFRCGLPNPGFNGSKGYIGAIVVKADSPGTGRINVNSNSQILANDGSGTNVINGFGSANFTIMPLPTGAPIVTAPTHPNQDSWYKNSTAILNWSGDGSNFSYTLDQNPDTVPDQISEGTATSKTFDGLTDGIWYFHIIVRGNNNTWSSPTNFRLQIDTNPPESFTPTANPKDNSEKRPIIGYSTTDKTSGVDHYELKVDDGKFVKVPNSYQLPSITSGKHTVYVKAVDKAGNERISSVEISIKDIAPPIITSPANGQVVPYGNNLVISGSATAGYNVKVFLDSKEIGQTKADKNGKFEFTYKELLSAGNHKLYAIALNPDNISSKSSNEISFTLDPQAYVILGQTIPSVTIWITFIVVLIILVVLFVSFWLGAKRFRRKLKTTLEKLEQEVEDELAKGKIKKEIKDEVEEDFDEAEKELGEK